MRVVKEQQTGLNDDNVLSVENNDEVVIVDEVESVDKVENVDEVESVDKVENVDEVESVEKNSVNKPLTLTDRTIRST